MARILVVDDLPTNRALLVTLLRYAGHETVEAGDGVEALAAVRAWHPALVLCDMLMPRMDGYAFVRALAEESELTATPVIFCTATFIEREALGLARACGVREVLIKPIEPEALLAAVARALDGAAALAPQAMQTAQTAPVGEGRFDDAHFRIVSAALLARVGELGQRNRRLATLGRLSLALASERRPDTLLQRLCDDACELIGARASLLRVSDAQAGPADAPLIHAAQHGLSAAEARAVATLGAEPTLAAGLTPEGGVRHVDAAQLQALGLPQARAGLLVPVASLVRVYGWLLLLDPQAGTAFDEDDAAAVAIHAALAGRVYENEHLSSRLQQHVAALEHEVERRRRSEAQLSGLIETAMDGIVVVDAAQRILIVNPAAGRIFGHEPAQLLGQPLERLIPPAHRARHGEDMARFGASGGAARHMGRDRVVSGLRADGETFPLDVSISAIGQGTDLRYLAILRDVSARVRAERQIRSLVRVSTLLGDINALIVRVRDRQALLDQACRLAVAQGGFLRAWVGFVEPDGLRLVASAGPQDGYIERLRTELLERVPGAAGSPLAYQVACRECRAHVVQDVEREPGLLLRDELLALGTRAMAWLPLVVDGTCVAIFALHADTAQFFDAQELALLEDLAGDMAYALEHIDQQERLLQLAYFDGLTGLANATRLHERMHEEIERTRREGGTLGLALVDLARFKGYNDTFGRKAGDALLRAVAQRLEGCFGDRSLLARIAGDRYAVLVPGPGGVADPTARLAAQGHACFDPPFEVEGRIYSVAARIGLAVCPDHGEDAETLYRNAEAALKQAKEGLDPVLVYRPSMNADVAERLALEHQLRLALERGEFELHYQPKVELVGRRIVGLEALLRWRHPERGLVPPLAFIPVLEHTGQIAAVGAWAFRRAAADQAAWRAGGLAAPRVAVNVSALQLRRDDFVPQLAALMQDVDQADRPALDIEITESVVMQDVDAVVQKLHELRRMGMEIALDDFGTGYSSLAYLSRLPAQALKIDRSFIDTMLREPNNMTLVSTMISMAQSLRMQVVAEGVETEAQAKILQALRCDQMQGYLIARPMPPEQIATLLAEAARADQPPG